MLLRPEITLVIWGSSWCYWWVWGFCTFNALFLRWHNAGSVKKNRVGREAKHLVSHSAIYRRNTAPACKLRSLPSKPLFSTFNNQFTVLTISWNKTLNPTENPEHCTASLGITETLRKLVQLSPLLSLDHIFLSVLSQSCICFFLVGLHFLVTQSCLVVSAEGQGTHKLGLPLAQGVGE